MSLVSIGAIVTPSWDEIPSGGLSVASTVTMTLDADLSRREESFQQADGVGSCS